MKKKIDKGGGGEWGTPPEHPSSKKPRKGFRHPGSAKGIEEAAPRKQEKTALKQARKSGQMTPTAVETKRKGRG